MSKYQLSSHIRCCLYNNKIVLLDLKSDSYNFLSEESSREFTTLFNYLLPDAIRDKFTDTSYIQDKEDKIKELLDVGYIKKTNEQLKEQPNKINICNNAGAENIDWRVPSDIFDKKINFFAFIKCYILLVYVHMYINIFGFYAIVKKLKLLQKKSKFDTDIDSKSINQHVLTLNRASFFYFKRVKCLEWSIILVLLLIKDRQPASLIVGIQDQPFASHAWVVVDNKVIGDSDSLMHNLAIMLRVPSYQVKVV